MPWLVLRGSCRRVPGTCARTQGTKSGPIRGDTGPATNPRSGASLGTPEKGIHYDYNVNTFMLLLQKKFLKLKKKTIYIFRSFSTQIL